MLDELRVRPGDGQHVHIGLRGFVSARAVSRRLLAICAVAACALLLGACGGAGSEGSDRVLTVGAIPDQDPQVLQRQFNAISGYLSSKLGVKVEYQPVTDYTASVTAFRNGDLDLVFFGGLTGVQARLQVPGARAIAQRDVDASFRSVFIANSDSGIRPVQAVGGLDTLAGHTFTFGSDVSTSGRLMPQYFLDRAGVQLEDLDGKPGFSGSHDRTIKLVEAGTYEVGALNEAVWDERRESGEVDTGRVREVFRTPSYNDYHWVVHPSVEKDFGAGFTQKAKAALLGLDKKDPEGAKILDLFEAGSFIDTDPDDYRRIEQIGREVGLISG